MTDSPSPTPIPAADGGGLPEEIKTAIKALRKATDSLALGYGNPVHVSRVRAALDAIILRHLSGVLGGGERGEDQGATPAGSGCSRAEPAGSLGPTAEHPSRMQWQPIATYQQGEYVEFWFERGERGNGMSEMARAFKAEHWPATDPAAWSFWTYGGPNSGYDFERDEVPTHWRPVRPGPLPAQETEAEGRNTEGGSVYEGSVGSADAPTLLSRLTTAETDRDEAQVRAQGEEIDAALDRAFRKIAEVQRDAALARAERLEKALAFYADDQNYWPNGPLDPNSSWFEGDTRARAALSSPSPSEET